MTVNSNHHPTEDVLLRYYAGHYEPAYNLVLASHVKQCKTCQDHLSILSEVAACSLEQEVPVGMAASASDVLNRSKSSEAVKPYEKVKVVSIDDYLINSLGDVKWKWLTPNLRQYIIPIGGKATARLLRIDAGHSVPPHGHSGEEMTLILSGGYFDGDEAYQKGDIHISNHETPHIPVAMKDQPCIVLAATDSPLIFQDLIPRLLQRFFKI